MMNDGKQIVFGLLFIALVITGCTGKHSSEVVLEVVGIDSSVTLTMDELQDMPTVDGWSGTISSTGVISPPMKIKGVSLVELADLVGGLQPSLGINIVAKDGYSITMSYDQITNGNFTTYDPGTGDERSIDDPLVAVVAFERDGEEIPEDHDGPLRIFVVSESNNQIIDGHWSVKWVEKLELKPLAEDWVLYLEGTITEDLDRASFESCTAPGCHAASWTDAEGDQWSGVPLYLLAGRVDDGNVHEDRAYNDDFAAQGYKLQVYASDGYNASIESSQSTFNEALIVASFLNGEPLGEDQFPLRLVGDALEKSQMVSQIAKIVIVPNEGVEEPSIEESASEQWEDQAIDLTLPEGVAIKITGDVRNQLALTTDNLGGLGIVEVEVEHPKKGLQLYRGVKLNLILSLAGIEAGATTLVMTAADGFTVELPLNQIQACENCLIALDADGTLSMAMDGMGGGFWVIDVIHLNVK